MSYFSVNPATPQDGLSPDFSGLDAQLHTEDGFAANVVVETNPRSTLILVAVVYAAILLMIENLYISVPLAPFGYAMPLSERLRWAFSPVTQYGYTNTFFYTLGVLPVLMLVGVAVYFIFKKTTQALSASKLFSQFQQSGWLAELTPTGLMVPVGRTVGIVSVFTNPSLPVGTAATAAAQISQAVSDRRNPQTRAYMRAVITAFRGVKAWQAVPGGQVDPTLPDGVFLALQQRSRSASPLLQKSFFGPALGFGTDGLPPSPLFQVVVPDGGRLNLHGLKRDISKYRWLTYFLPIVVLAIFLYVAVGGFGG